MTQGGPPGKRVITTKGQKGDEDDPFAPDVLTLNKDQNLDSWMRLCGFDFFVTTDRAGV